MCGIVGLINIGSHNVIAQLLETQEHRGPDDNGIEWFAESNSGLGHNRLSILDLSNAGHQPMSNAKRNLWITFNGEIYNFIDIKNELFKKGYRFISKTDTEVILYAYEEWGVECLNKFNGMFAFAIWDNEKKELFAARDRLGIKPFYYFVDEKCGGLVFSSEIKTLLASKLIPKEVDYNAIITPTRFQVSPFTGFQGIKKLEAGHYILFRNSQLSKSKYWEINPSEKEIPEKEAVSKLDELLNDSVRMQMIADVPVGIFLSGGLDSSIIAALMRKNSNHDIHSFTIKFSEADQKFEKLVNDSFYAKKVAEQFGFIHHEFEIESSIMDLLPKMVYHLDEPITDPASINTYIMARHARSKGIIVMLNGMGGDEVFAGYRKHLACLFAGTLQHFTPKSFFPFLTSLFYSLPVATNTEGIKLSRWIKRFLSFASLPEYDRYLASDLIWHKEIFEELFNNKASFSKSHFYNSQKKYFEYQDVSYLAKMCLSDTKVFLPEHNLTYSDKATMTASIESRPPLLDHRIVEFMFSLQPKYRINRRSQKYLLKKVSEKYLPQLIINRPKAPFASPLRSWLKGPLRQMTDDLLSEHEIKKRGLWNYRVVEKLIKDDRNGREDNAFFIYQLLTLQIWFKTFFDKN